MARPTFTVPETDMKNEFIRKIRTRFGNLYEGRDSTFMAFAETIGDELNLIRRETESKFSTLQMSNAAQESLDSIALNTYGLQRRPASRAYIDYRESNLYFYIEEGTFGDINNGSDIILPEGVTVSVKSNALGSNVNYVLTQTYTLPADQKIGYCSAQSIDTGFSQNVGKESLTFHDFTNYTKADSGSLKVSNRFAVLNGADRESDRLFRSRLNNFLTARTNLNEDWLILKAIMVPGVADVRMIPNYFGIGTLGMIVHGAGRESTESLINFVRRRAKEVISPGLSIEVVGGINVYLDFDIRVYIKSVLGVVQKQGLVSLIKENIYRILEEAEFRGFIDFNQISNLIKSSIQDVNILGFGRTTNGTLFEKVYERKSDRFGALPEYREELVSNTLSLAEDEKLSFGVVNVILEVGDA